MTLKECSSHPRYMLDSMNSLKKNEEFCDITIVAGQDEIKVHKFVLIVATEYFRAMFSGDTKESNTGIVSFPDTPGEIVKQCINFIYTGKVDFTLNHITDFIKASDIFCLHDLTDLYVGFLSENITMGNVAQMLSVSRIYDKKLLKTKIQIFFQKDLKRFVKSKELRSIPKENFLYLLSLDENWGREYEMLKWTAVVTWVKHDMVGRKDAFDDCFQSINLAFIPQRFIKENIVCEALVNDSKKCLQKIVCNDYALDESSKVPLACGEQMTGIITFHTTSRTLSRYSLIEEKWSKFSQLPYAIKTEWLDVVEHKGIIYVTTGNAVFSYSELEWKKLYESDLKEGYNRCIICGKYIAMVTPEQVILYEIGIGTSSSIKIQRDEKYTREKFAIASVEVYIYMIDSEPGSSNTHAFKINLSTMRCDRIANIPISITERSVFSYNKTVYAISDYSREVVFYNNISRQWKSIPSLTIENYFAGCNILAADKLYLYGKNSGTKVRAVELDKLMVSEKYNKFPATQGVDMSVSCASFLK